MGEAVWGSSAPAAEAGAGGEGVDAGIAVAVVAGIVEHAVEHVANLAQGSQDAQVVAVRKAAALEVPETVEAPCDADLEALQST